MLTRLQLCARMEANKHRKWNRAEAPRLHRLEEQARLAVAQAELLPHFGAISSAQVLAEEPNNRDINAA